MCEKASLSDAFWVCSNIVTQCKSKLSGQNVLLFTCSDAPYSSTASHLTRQAVCKVRDLYDASIDIELLSLGPNFDVTKFYESLLTLNGELPDRSIVAGGNGSNSERLCQLQERVRRLQHKQRATGRVCFQLAPDLEMSVGFYTSISTARKPSQQKLHRTANEVVKTVTKEFMDDTGELLMTSDFCKYQEYGGKKIKFSIEESRAINKVYPAGLQLLGFKPASSVQAFHFIKPASFIYPDDKNILGSSSLFAALLARCKAKTVVPFVRVVARTNSAPSWAALVPQEEEVDEQGFQIRPPGFHVTYLPFADDFRKVEIESKERATTEQVDLAKAIIKKLHFRYDPSSFENPDLQTHWRNIEALALNRQSDELAPVLDHTGGFILII